MILSITQAGKKIRLGQITNQKTGRAVIAAMDHGLVLGPIKGIEKIEDTLKKVLPGKPDAVMMNLGSAKRCLNGLLGKEAPGLILRLDDPICARPIVPFEETDQTITLYSAEDAIKIGASAVITTLLIGLSPEEIERYNIEYVAKHIQECERWGLPIIIETLIFGRRAVRERSVERFEFDLDTLKMICREASEIGADIIKAPYAGSYETMKEVVKSCSTPILVLGGGKMEKTEELLVVVKNSIDAGCIGCFVGRNVWQHKKPQKVLAALRKIVHENSDVEEATKLLS